MSKKSQNRVSVTGRPRVENGNTEDSNSTDFFGCIARVLVIAIVIAFIGGIIWFLWKIEFIQFVIYALTSGAVNLAHPEKSMISLDIINFL